MASSHALMASSYLPLVSESRAFVVPGRGIFGIEPDGLIVSLDGFIVLALDL